MTRVTPEQLRRDNRTCPVLLQRGTVAGAGGSRRRGWIEVCMMYMHVDADGEIMCALCQDDDGRRG